MDKTDKAMVYNSIEPKDMNQVELMSICGELQVAKNYNQETIKVDLKDKTLAAVPTNRLKEYQGAFRTITGTIKL